jgi:NADH-quinone oxidoreductase subunit M
MAGIGASNALGYPLLTVILALPAVVGAVCWAIDNTPATRILASVAAVVDFVLAAYLFVEFKTSGPAAGWWFQFSDKHTWIQSLPGVSNLGITYWLGVDGVSVFLVVLTALMMAVAILAATFMIGDNLRAFLILMLFLETAILGVFMSINLFLFFVFWEAMLIPSYFLLGIWGEDRRLYATMKFLVYTIFGSFLMLVGIFYLWTQTGTLDMVGPHGLLAHPVSGSAQTWLFLAFGLAFAIKLPLFPFHTWAPTAYAESPTPFVVALAGILSKAGAFGFIRYCLPLFPAATHQFQGLIQVLAIIGILYGAALALVQVDTKRLVAYSSVSHMNLIALGIFSLNATGIDGSVLQMINHSVIISGLFLAVAYIAARTGTRMLTDLGGLGERWPVLMWLFFVFVLAGLDLPGLGSFSGEFLILVGVFRENAWFSAIAALTVILAAWYMIRFFQNSMNGPVTASPESVSVVAEDPGRTPYQYPVARRRIPGDMLPGEIALWVPLILVILFIGIRPVAFTDRMNPTTGSVTTVLHPTTSSSVGGGR